MKKEEILEYIKSSYTQDEIEQLICELPRAEEITIKEKWIVTTCENTYLTDIHTKEYPLERFRDILENCWNIPIKLKQLKIVRDNYGMVGYNNWDYPKVEDVTELWCKRFEQALKKNPEIRVCNVIEEMTNGSLVMCTYEGSVQDWTGDQHVYMHNRV